MFSSAVLNTPAPKPGHCVRCGERLGAEPHWITDVPDGEHVRCRDYRERPFPYDALLRKVRHRYRTHRRLLRSIERLGRWLAERKRRWPEDAVSTVGSWAQAREKVR